MPIKARFILPSGYSLLTLFTRETETIQLTDWPASFSSLSGLQSHLESQREHLSPLQFLGNGKDKEMKGLVPTYWMAVPTQQAVLQNYLYPPWWWAWAGRRWPCRCWGVLKVQHRESPEQDKGTALQEIRGFQPSSVSPPGWQSSNFL